jgi:polar amino acid transport system substrate-binding protein
MQLFNKNCPKAALVLCATLLAFSVSCKKNEFRVATSPDFPPYESIGANGEYIGLDIDMAFAIAAQLRLEAVIVPTDFDGIISAVSTGKADIGMSGLSVTPERRQSVDFTVNIADEGQIIMVRADSAIKSPADLEGTRVGSQNGTTGLQLAQFDQTLVSQSEYAATMRKPAEAIGYEDFNLAAIDLRAGKIDAIIYDASPLMELAAQNPELTILKDENGTTISLISLFNAYITKKGSGFAEKVNGAIAALKASGELAAIYAKYPTIIPAQ